MGYRGILTENIHLQKIYKYLDKTAFLHYLHLYRDLKNLKNIKIKLDDSHYGMEEAKERIITTALITKLINYCQKDYDSYSYHVNLGLEGDVFFPWISSWTR